MFILQLLILAAIAALYRKASRLMSLLESANALKVDVTAVFDLIATKNAKIADQAKTISDQTAANAAQAQTIADLQAAAADAPAAEQIVNDLDAQAKAVLAAEQPPTPEAPAQ